MLASYFFTPLKKRSRPFGSLQAYPHTAAQQKFCPPANISTKPKLATLNGPFLLLVERYRKVVSSNTSRLEAHAGFFRLLMKEIFDPNVLCDLLTKKK